MLRGSAPPALLDSYEAERRGVVAETVASAAANMRALPADLAADAAAIQRVKSPEFHNLGLVLGYSYAGSPVVQPGGGAAVADVGRYTPSASRAPGLPHCWLPDGTSLYDSLGAGFTLVTPARRRRRFRSRFVRTAPCAACPPHRDRGARGLPLAGVPAGAARSAHRVAGQPPGGHRPRGGSGQRHARLTGPGGPGTYHE